MSHGKRVGALRATFSSYSNHSTVHGISYLANSKLTKGDRLFWLLVLIIFGALAVVISLGVFQEWSSNPVITILRNTELPVSKLDFPAITICRQGLDMDSLEEHLEEEYQTWSKKNRDKRQTYRSSDIDRFLDETFGLGTGESIFEVIIGMISRQPNITFGNNALRKS